MYNLGHLIRICPQRPLPIKKLLLVTNEMFPVSSLNNGCNAIDQYKKESRVICIVYLQSNQ
jgi:hypothetical protein